MATVRARLGFGVPVDFEEFIALGATSSSWRPTQATHPEFAHLEPNEFIRALAEHNESSGAFRVMVRGDGNLRVAAVFAAASHHGHVSFSRIPAVEEPAVFDRLASVADQVMYFSQGSGTGAYVMREICAGRSGIAAGLPRRCLPGVAEVHWFGERMVSWFGGDEVFESMPAGWAERTEYGQWRLNGLDLAADPDGFQLDRWSSRERAIIEHIGVEFFFDVEAGVVPETTPPQPPVGFAPFESYLWRDGELVIRSVDGSLRPAGS